MSRGRTGVAFASILMLFSSSVMALEPRLAGQMEQEPPDPESLKPIRLNFDEARTGLIEKGGKIAVFNACAQDVQRTKDVELVRGDRTCGEGQPLKVRAGDILSIRAWGTIRSSGFVVVPNGAKARERTGDLPPSSHNIDPSIPHGALLCKTSSETKWHYCGQSAYGKVSAEGQLQFTVNDRDQTDNTGLFEISVAINNALHAGNRPPWAGMSRTDWDAQFKGLPDCYCSVFDIPEGPGSVRMTIRGRTVHLPRGLGEPGLGGKWSARPMAEMNSLVSGRFHPGATIDFRWSTTSRPAGQQCTYDDAGALITRGPGAGTPDIHSPTPPDTLDRTVDPRKLWEKAKNLENSLAEHKAKDIQPFQTMALGAYLARWQPNKGLRGVPTERALARAKGTCEENPQDEPPFSRLP